MVILCGYKKQVGKDTFCQLLKELYPDKVIQRFAFADALKEEAYEFLLKPNNLPKSILDDPETKPYFRTFMQWYGTEFRRNPHPKIGGDPDYWTKRLIEKILEFIRNNPQGIAVICDGRFLNEILITKKELNAVALLIKRDAVYDPNEQHISEIELDSHIEQFDYTIENNSDVDAFRHKIKDFMDKILNHGSKL